MDLDINVSQIPFVGKVYVRRLKRLEITTVSHLLYHVPHRYLDFRKTSKISELSPGEITTVKGQITSIANQYTKRGKKIQVAELNDGTGNVHIVWFNQPYLVRSLPAGTHLSLAGEVGWWARKKAFISPEYEKIAFPQKSVHTAGLIPIYHQTAGVSSKWLRSRIADTFSKVEDRIDDYFCEKILKKYKLVGLKEAIKSIHFPKKFEDVERGKKRLSFDELLFLHLTSLFKKLDWNRNKTSKKLKIELEIISQFINSLSFELTKSQKRAVKEILRDLQVDSPMNRLLQGDVGSGKTVVAATAAFATFANGFQSVFMAPTQILAQQHYETLRKLFDPFKIRVSLITSTGVKADLGKSDILVGTHALIYKKVDFDSVSLVVIDEQHRFGVEQRAKLIRKTGKRLIAPHVLTMTATPIPRTIVLAAYGNLNLSTLDELPKGRKPVTTWSVPARKRQAAYDWIKKQIKKEKTQAFIICPLIEESEVETMKQVRAAKAEYEKLQDVFMPLEVGLLHGRQKAKEKEDILTKFKKKKTDLLVSTPVVEVGIDVPNATIMLIEAAERFGLAQLHQLRGRIGRGDKKSYCLLFTEVRSEKINARLEAMKRSNSGFDLAELDLKLRGPGEIFGFKQHGFPELKIASWSDYELIRQTRKLAEDVVENPEKYSEFYKKFQERLVAN